MPNLIEEQAGAKRGNDFPRVTHSLGNGRTGGQYHESLHLESYTAISETLSQNKVTCSH